MLPKLPDLVLLADKATLTHEDYGEVRMYFEGPTDQLSLMVAGSLVLKPGASPHPRHKHPEEEFLLITQGTGEISIGDDVTAVSAGSMMYCAAEHWHGVTNTGSEPMTFYFYKWLK